MHGRLLHAGNHPHAAIPCPSFQAEQGAMSRQAGDRKRLPLPLQIQIVKPQIGNVAAYPVHCRAARFPLFAKRHAGREALIENHFVETGRFIALAWREIAAATAIGSSDAAMPA